MNDPYLSARDQIAAVLDSRKTVPTPIRTYLESVESFAAAHACPLLDAEIAFISSLHDLYVTST